MTRAAASNQPTVEELLVSIRQAIHGGKGLPPASAELGVHRGSNGHSNGEPNGSVSGSMREMRVSLDSGNRKNGNSSVQDENFRKLKNQLHEMGATAPHEPAKRSRTRSKPPGISNQNGAASGFSGILSGELRLEDALAKLKQAGLQQAADYDTGSDYVEPGRAPLAPTGIRHIEPEPVEQDYDYIEDAQFSEEFIGHQEQQEYAPIAPPAVYSRQTREHYLEPKAVTAPVRAPEPAQDAEPEPAPLTSRESAAATSAAFSKLTDAIVGHASSGERSIDEITRELLRPMLQSWLDENLPRLAERLVREEIERVARWGNK
jgi:cell pole-organizing protein PopZ